MATPAILLVEDNAINQKVAVGLLRQIGLDADIAVDGLEGIGRFSAKSYDLVIMDCQMPRCDGWEATRVIRRMEESMGKGRIPIVALTAQAMAGDRERCLAAGMDDYLTKPVDPGLFVRAVRSWLHLPPGNPTPSAALPVVVAANTTANAVLDERVVERIRGYGADAMAEVYGTMAEELPVRRQALAQAIDAGDLKAVASQAHAIKGGSGTLGLQALHLTCARIDAVARTGDVQSAREAWPDADRQFNLAISALNRLLGS